MQAISVKSIAGTPLSGVKRSQTRVQPRVGAVKVTANVKPATKAGMKAKTTSGKPSTGQYICLDCGWIYDPKKYKNVPFEKQPDNFRCPVCQAPKRKFRPVSGDGSAENKDDEGTALIAAGGAFAFAVLGLAYYITAVGK